MFLLQNEENGNHKERQAIYTFWQDKDKNKSKTRRIQDQEER